MTCWTEYKMEEMQSDFAKLAGHRFRAGGSYLREISSSAAQRNFVVVDLAKVLNLASGSGGLENIGPREVFEPDDVVQDNDKNLNLERNVTAVVVETSELRGNVRTLGDNCRLDSVIVLNFMLAVVELVNRSMRLAYQVTKREQTLIEVEQKLQVASIMMLLSHHSALARAEEARKCCEETDGANEGMKTAQIVANKTRYDARAPKEQVSKFEADYLAESEGRPDNVLEVIKRLYHKTASAAAGTKQLAVVLSKLDSRKVHIDFLERH